MSGKEERRTLKKFLSEMVQDQIHKQAQFDDGTFPPDDDMRNIFKYSQYATSHMHNGNKKAYMKYKQKTLDAFSTVLDLMMAETGGLMLQEDSGESNTKDGAVVRFGTQMKEFHEKMSELEKITDEAGLWK